MFCLLREHTHSEPRASMSDPSTELRPGLATCASLECPKCLGCPCAELGQGTAESWSLVESPGLFHPQETPPPPPPPSLLLRVALVGADA